MLAGSARESSLVCIACSQRLSAALIASALAPRAFSRLASVLPVASSGLGRSLLKPGSRISLYQNAPWVARRPTTRGGRWQRHWDGRAGVDVSPSTPHSGAKLTRACVPRTVNGTGQNQGVGRGKGPVAVQLDPLHGLPAKKRDQIAAPWLGRANETHA